MVYCESVSAHRCLVGKDVKFGPPAKFPPPGPVGLGPLAMSLVWREGLPPRIASSLFAQIRQVLLLTPVRLLGSKCFLGKQGPVVYRTILSEIRKPFDVHICWSNPTPTWNQVI